MDPSTDQGLAVASATTIRSRQSEHDQATTPVAGSGLDGVETDMVLPAGSWCAPTEGSSVLVRNLWKTLPSPVEGLANDNPPRSAHAHYTGPTINNSVLARLCFV